MILRTAVWKSLAWWICRQNCMENGFFDSKLATSQTHGFGSFFLVFAQSFENGVGDFQVSFSGSKLNLGFVITMEITAAGKF